jgi:hypothetical protein
VDRLLADAEPWLARAKEPERMRALVAAAQAAGGDTEAGGEARSALRMHLFREAEAILVQDGFPVMPIYFYVVSSFVKPYVRGWHENPQDVHPLRGISIARDGE